MNNIQRKPERKSNNLVFKNVVENRDWSTDVFPGNTSSETVPCNAYSCCWDGVVVVEDRTSPSCNKSIKALKYWIRPITYWDPDFILPSRTYSSPPPPSMPTMRVCAHFMMTINVRAAADKSRSRLGLRYRARAPEFGPIQVRRC